MSAENRTVRPFQGLGRLERVLDNAVLYFGPDRIAANGYIDLDVGYHEYLLRPVRLSLCEDRTSWPSVTARIQEGLEEAELEPSVVELLAVARSAFLKYADIVLCLPASALLRERSAEFDLTSISGGRAKAFSTPWSGFWLDLYLAVSKDLDPAPLKPWRRGTWLARTQFRVSAPLSASVLPPVPLTPELRADLQLPKEAVHYIDFGDHDVLEPIEGQEEPTFYVDADLLALAVARRASPSSRAFQLGLVQVLVSSIIWRAAAASKIRACTYGEVVDSLLGRVIRLIAGTKATESHKNALIQLVGTKPELVVAMAESAIGYLTGMSSALEEREQ